MAVLHVANVKSRTVELCPCLLRQCIQTQSAAHRIQTAPYSQVRRPERKANHPPTPVLSLRMQEGLTSLLLCAGLQHRFWFVVRVCNIHSQALGFLRHVKEWRWKSITHFAPPGTRFNFTYTLPPPFTPQRDTAQPSQLNAVSLNPVNEYERHLKSEPHLTIYIQW